MHFHLSRRHDHSRVGESSSKFSLVSHKGNESASPTTCDAAVLLKIWRWRWMLLGMTAEGGVLVCLKVAEKGTKPID